MASGPAYGYVPWNIYMETVPAPTTVEQVQLAAQIRFNDSWKNIENVILKTGGDPNNFDSIAWLAGVDSMPMKDGNKLYYYRDAQIDNLRYSPNPYNSTGAVNTRTQVRPAVSTTKVMDKTDEILASLKPTKGAFTQNAMYFIGQVGQAATAASAGIWLGKTIDSLLYNAAPDYWDSIGLSGLNPDTWSSITAGDDSLGANLFNWIFGIDPDTGNMQAYMDADALSYMAYGLKENGWFSVNYETPELPETNPGTYTITSGLDLNTSASIFFSSYSQIYNNAVTRFNWSLSDFISLIQNTIPNYSNCVWCMEANQTVVFVYAYELNTPLRCRAWTASNALPYRIESSDSLRIYNDNATNKPYVSQHGGFDFVFPLVLNGRTSIIIGEGNRQSAYFNGINTTEISGVPGTSDQPGSILPDVSTWTDIPSTDSYLRTTYPDIYNNAIEFDNVQPDGTVLTKTYIPAPMPFNTTSPDTSTNTDPWNNTQPTSDGSKQNDTLINVNTSPETFIKDLIKTLTQTVTLPKTDVDNPTTTGTGDTPTPVPISGAASALWSVYHPSQAQINSFGAWLWTDNVIQQFIQLLNNPMEGIITLHKVFAPPVDSGSGTIVVGRLDSEVPSATVTQQYVSVDCGSVNVDEYYGNVFDYPPYTTISLYLPFIGFVPLNPDDIMRSTVHIEYGVDIFTGACLAIVDVSRDGNNVGMYQYSGVASVEYPLTGAQHSGLVSGLLGVAGGIAGVAMASTGVGAVAGASAIAGGLTNFAKTNNARSGGFSGNAGAMGVKIPYMIFERPLTKVAQTFDVLSGYPTNYSVRLGDCSGNVVVSDVHVSGINATDNELQQIESILRSGVIV